LERLEVERFAEADFEGALDNGNSGVGGVPVMFVKTCGNESFLVERAVR
jgi:hypothetical protein